MLLKSTLTSRAHAYAQHFPGGHTAVEATRVACWFPVVISGCMAIYVAGASRQGLGWFSPMRNPYLHAQLAAGAGAVALLGERPPKSVLLLAGASWGAFAALITRQRLHFREWRYIVSAHAPLVALLVGYVFLTE